MGNNSTSSKQPSYNANESKQRMKSLSKLIQLGLFSQKENSEERVRGEKKSNCKFLSVNELMILRFNKPLSEDEIVAIGTEIYPHTKEYPTRNGNNSIAWLTQTTISDNHVKAICEEYKKANRFLHINTSRNINENDDIILDNKTLSDSIQNSIVKDDKKILPCSDLFSVHVVTSSQPPIYPENIDVLDAWSYSKKDYAMNLQKYEEAVKIQYDASEEEKSSKESIKNSVCFFFNMVPDCDSSEVQLGRSNLPNEKLNSLREAVKDSPLDIQLTRNLVEELSRNGQKLEAYQVYQDLIKSGCIEYSVYLEKLDFLQKQCPNNPVLELEAIFDVKYHQSNNKFFHNQIFELINKQGRIISQYFYEKLYHKKEIDPKILALYGDICFQVGEHDRALSFQQQAEKEDRTSHHIKRKIALTFMRKNDLIQALEYINESILQNSKDKISYFIKGLIYYTQGFQSEADLQFDKALKIDNDYSYAYLGKGVTSISKGEEDQAIEYLNKAVELNNVPEASENLGFIYKSQSKWDKVESSFLESIKGRQGRIDVHYELATMYYKDKRYQESLDHWDLVIQLDPNSEAISKKGDCFYCMEKYRDAIIQHSIAVQISPQDAFFHFQKGCSEFNDEDYLEASYSFKQAMQLNPQNSEAKRLYELAKKFLQRDSLGEAQKLAQESKYYIKQNKLDQAIEFIDQAIKLAPSYGRFLYEKAMILSYQGNRDQTLYYLGSAISANPQLYDAYIKRAELYVTLEQDRAAIKDYEKAIELKPSCTKAYFKKADCLVTLNNGQEAISTYQEIIKIDPDMVQAYGLIGLLCEKDANYYSAKIYYKQAMSRGARQQWVFDGYKNCLEKLK